MLIFNDINIYTLQDQNTIGPYFFLPLTYHACVFDLTRVTLPGYSFPLAAAFFQVPESLLSNIAARRGAMSAVCVEVAADGAGMRY
jgi:hypothetical protein